MLLRVLYIVPFMIPAFCRIALNAYRIGRFLIGEIKNKHIANSTNHFHLSILAIMTSTDVPPNVDIYEDRSTQLLSVVVTTFMLAVIFVILRFIARSISKS